MDHQLNTENTDVEMQLNEEETDQREKGAHLILVKMITWIKGEINVVSSRGIYKNMETPILKIT